MERIVFSIPVLYIMLQMCFTIHSPCLNDPTCQQWLSHSKQLKLQKPAAHGPPQSRDHSITLPSKPRRIPFPLFVILPINGLFNIIGLRTVLSLSNEGQYAIR